MIRVGITGGIGTGKSTVAKIFASLGVPIFYSDDQAKQLIVSNPELIAAISENFGADVYSNNILQKQLLAQRAFESEERTALLNNIVHPFVHKALEDWFQQQTAPYAIQEAALLVESQSFKKLDVVIGVTAPLELRLQRLRARDPHLSEQDLNYRMERQMPEEVKRNFYKFTIENNEQSMLIPQVLEIHNYLLNRAK